MRRKVIPRAGLLHPEHFTRFCSQCVGDDVDEGDFAFTVGAPKAIQARSRGERDLCQGFFTLLRLCSLCFFGGSKQNGDEGARYNFCNKCIFRVNPCKSVLFSINGLTLMWSFMG